MKRNIILLLLLTILVLPGLAQEKDKNKHQKHQEILEMKLEYLASEIELKPEQKKQFNELYSKMETERWAVLKKLKKAEKSINDNQTASEADYDKATKEINAAKAEMANIAAQYNKKFSTFLSKKQMFKLAEAEKKFYDKMKGCRNKKRAEIK